MCLWTAVDPAFCLMRSHSMVKLAFLFIWRKFDFLKRLGVATSFCFIFLRKKQNKKKKNPKCAEEKKQVYEKPSLSLGVRLLIEKVQ